MIAWLTREPDGWRLRLDSGEPDPPVYQPTTLVLSPSAEAWFLHGLAPAPCAWCGLPFLPRRRGQQYCTARCRGAAYWQAGREGTE